jgi:hypothetical protein
MVDVPLQFLVNILVKASLVAANSPRLERQVLSLSQPRCLVSSTHGCMASFHWMVGFVPIKSPRSRGLTHFRFSFFQVLILAPLCCVLTAGADSDGTHATHVAMLLELLETLPNPAQIMDMSHR